MKGKWGYSCLTQPLIAIGRMQASVQLHLKVKLDLTGHSSMHGSSAKLSGLICRGWGSWGCSLLLSHRLGPANRLLPSSSTSSAMQQNSPTWTLTAVCGAGDWLPWAEKLLCPFPAAYVHWTPFPPLHIAGYCPSAVISAKPHPTSDHPSWPKVCHWAAVAVLLITAHPKGTLRNCMLRAI